MPSVAGDSILTWGIDDIFCSNKRQLVNTLGNVMAVTANGVIDRHGGCGIGADFSHQVTNRFLV